VTQRRRKMQAAYNKEHDITPRSAQRTISKLGGAGQGTGEKTASSRREEGIPPEERTLVIAALREEMSDAAEKMEFERAAALRDRIKELTLDGTLAPRTEASSPRSPSSPRKRNRRR
jgi:excinuclease ABC subunit B